MAETRKLATKLAGAVRQRVRFADKSPAPPEPINATPRRTTGFFASLSPEQKRKALQYRGDDGFVGAELANGRKEAAKA